MLIQDSNMKPDHGHKHLIEDLRQLLAEAEAKEFHDFENTKYPMPKRKLMECLQVIMDNVVQGAYDN